MSGGGNCAWEGEGAGAGPLGIDYVHAYHCGFKEHGWLFYPVLLVWGCFITYLMGHTADAYFSPTLATLSDKLKLTYDVAGVTFLALGNGAPDVFSSIAAFSSEDPQVVLIGVCELLGASVFVTTVVVGAVALLHPASVRPQAFARDILFQVLANLMLTASALYGRITVGLALAYLGLYALYVLVVLYLDRSQRRAAHGHGGVHVQEPDELGLGDGSGVMSAFWFTPSDITEFHRALETQTVHKLTHDFLLLDDDELSSESDSDSEGEGGEEGGRGGKRGRRRRNSSVDQARHPFTHSLISEYFPDPGSRMDHQVVDGRALLLSSATPNSSAKPTNGKGRSGSTSSSSCQARPTQPGRPASSPPAINGSCNGNGSPNKLPRSFVPFSTAAAGAAGAEEVYKVTGASLSDEAPRPQLSFASPSHAHAQQQGGGAGAVTIQLPGPPQLQGSPSSRPLPLNQQHRRQHTSIWGNMYWHQWRLRRRLLREFHASDFLQKSLPSKLLALVELPLIVARNVTVPLVEEEAWSRLNASLCPLFAPAFLLAAFGLLGAIIPDTGIPLWVPLELGGAVLAVAVRLTTHDSRPPSGFAYSMALAAAGFIMCSAWIYTIATELVAVVTSLGKLWGIPSSLLGLTLLAWGNSAGDLITNIAVARAGLSDMAVAGCFAGPTFNLLVGLGCSFLWKVVRSGPFTLQFDQRAYISLSFLYLGLGLNLGIGYFSKFQLGRTLALPLLGLYAACTLLQITLIALGLSSPDG